jgi:hypothetical protein
MRPLRKTRMMLSGTKLQGRWSVTFLVVSSFYLTILSSQCSSSTRPFCAHLVMRLLVFCLTWILGATAVCPLLPWHFISGLISGESLFFGDSSFKFSVYYFQGLRSNVQASRLACAWSCIRWCFIQTGHSVPSTRALGIRGALWRSVLRRYVPSLRIWSPPGFHFSRSAVSSP